MALPWETGVSFSDYRELLRRGAFARSQVEASLRKKHEKEQSELAKKQTLEIDRLWLGSIDLLEDRWGGTSEVSSEHNDKNAAQVGSVDIEEPAEPPLTPFRKRQRTISDASMTITPFTVAACSPSPASFTAQSSFAANAGLAPPAAERADVEAAFVDGNYLAKDQVRKDIDNDANCATSTRQIAYDSVAAPKDECARAIARLRTLSDEIKETIRTRHHSEVPTRGRPSNAFRKSLVDNGTPKTTVMEQKERTPTPELSEFQKRRNANKVANQALLNDISPTKTTTLKSPKTPKTPKSAKKHTVQPASRSGLRSSSVSITRSDSDT